MTTPIPQPVVPALQPTDLGLPPKFAQWRPGQYEATIQAVSSDRQFIAAPLTTGGGKSGMAVCTAILLGGRTVIVTSTKGLEDQYQEFAGCGLVDFRGRQNYDCLSHGTCSDGRLAGCSHAQKSPDSPADCPYIIDRETFLGAQITSTNYACYFANVMHGEGMGNIDLLILDEAHNALEELAKALTIVLEYSSIEAVCKKSGIPDPPKPDSSIGHWRKWAETSGPTVKALFDRVKKEGGHTSWLRVIDSVKSTLSRIETIPDSWIVDESRAGEISFAPLWPTDYAEAMLYRGAKKVLFLSATIVPKTTDLLGVPKDKLLFLPCSHSFDPRRSPVYLYGAHYIDYKTSQEKWEETVGRMDSIIQRRLDRKGVIHPVSYDRATFILQHSYYKGLMISPKGKELHESLKLFKESPPPRLLISPAITTGYDFPGREAEYQFMIKVPFIDARSPIMKARSKADPEYVPYLVAQIFTQTCGRLMRSPEDQSETFILDRYANNFLKPAAPPGIPTNSRNRGGYRHLFPDWFLRQVQYPSTQPYPPRAL